MTDDTSVRNLGGINSLTASATRVAVVAAPSERHNSQRSKRKYFSASDRDAGNLQRHSGFREYRLHVLEPSREFARTLGSPVLCHRVFLSLLSTLLLEARGGQLAFNLGLRQGFG